MKCLDQQFSDYSTENIGLLIHHMLRHSEDLYLPPTLVSGIQNLPTTIRPHNIEFVRAYVKRKAEIAIQKFSKVALEMDFLKIGFAPVLIEIEGVVVESDMTDFYRSISLFKKFLDIPLSLFDNREPCARNYMQRILKFGSSAERDGPFPFFEKKSPYCTQKYETQTYVKKLKNLHKR